jgi:ferredoxin
MDSKKHPQNVPGRFYVTDDCLSCETCQFVAPKNFRYGDNGFSYVFKQPGNPEEVKQCEEAVLGCPLEAVRGDGGEMDEHPRNQIFRVGDTVRIVSGPFVSFTGKIEGINQSKALLHVKIAIYGRNTPIRLNFSDVEVVSTS